MTDKSTIETVILRIRDLWDEDECPSLDRVDPLLDELRTLAAPPSPPPSAGVDAVAVKALEWQEDQGAFIGHGNGLRYTIIPPKAERNWYVWRAFDDDKALVGGILIANAVDAATAKAAAQADYVARSALAKPASEPADGAVREALLSKAQAQVEYWNNRQCSEKALEDATDEAGNYSPLGDGAAWSSGYCNGRYSEADWWLKTIATLSAPASSSPAKPAPAVEAVREALKAAVLRGTADEFNGRPSGNIIEKGCEAAEYIHVADAAAMFVDCIVDEVLAALAPAAQAGTVAQEGER